MVISNIKPRHIEDYNINFERRGHSIFYEKIRLSFYKKPIITMSYEVGVFLTFYIKFFEEPLNMTGGASL